MKQKDYKAKIIPTLFFIIFFAFIFLSGCSATLPPTDENQVAQVIDKYFQAINHINREEALSYTIPDGAAYQATNSFFDTKVPLAEAKNTRYEYSYEMKTISVLDNIASAEFLYTFRLIGFTDILAPTFNGNFTLKKVNGVWLLDVAPLAS